MDQQRTHTDFTGQTIYVGLDVHRASWQVSIHTAEMDFKTFTQAPRPEVLLTYLHRTFPGARYICAYEAGFSGFSAARTLRAANVECLVVHPPDIPTTSYDRTHKNDRTDARRLGQALRSGQLRSVYVPTADAVGARTLVRTRSSFVKKQTRCKTQIKLALYNLGIDHPADIDARYWSRGYIAWLEGHAQSAHPGASSLRAMLDELTLLRTVILSLTRQIRSLSLTPPYDGVSALLRTVPGVGVLAAMTVITEVVDIYRFRSSDALASFVGLVPGESSSGEKTVTTGVTNRRNARLRHALIECAWAGIRHDPALLRVFQAATRRMVKQKAIVLVARRLLNRIRFVWMTGCAYEHGITSTRRAGAACGRKARSRGTRREVRTTTPTHR